jgi:hypothetical protein
LYFNHNKKCPSKQVNTTHGVNVWVNAQGFATWQILFSESQKQHENFVMFKGIFFTVFKIK